MKPPSAALPRTDAPPEDDRFLGLAPVARMAFAGADLGPVKARLLERLTRDENDANALMDLSIVLHLMGQRQLALSLQAMALRIQPLYRLPSATGAGIHLLAMVVPGDLTENNALEFLTEGSDITLDLLYLAPDLPLPATAPDHDLAMVAVCESDRNRPVLKYIESLVERWPRPVLCLPHRIARLSRDGACRLLQSSPGVVMPETTRINRRTLERTGGSVEMFTGLEKDGQFPLIIRPVDSQKGHGLRRLDTADAITDYLKTRPEKEFYMSRYVDYRGADGQFRKYRIVLIDGRPYACHMAISADWISHYMTAGMLESAGKRAEEARFFATFDDGFAVRHRAALTTIAERLELEYVGIDCAETPTGELLIFEVDSGMTVHSMDSAVIFPYKRPQMLKVFRAFRQMLLDLATRRQV